MESKKVKVSPRYILRHGPKDRRLLLNIPDETTDEELEERLRQDLKDGVLYTIADVPAASSDIDPE